MALPNARPVGSVVLSEQQQSGNDQTIAESTRVESIIFAHYIFESTLRLSPQHCACTCACLGTIWQIWLLFLAFDEHGIHPANRAAAMFDFCFTFPYATVLAFGGVLGLLTKGSFPSLLGGCGSAAILFLAANSSLKAYQRRAVCRSATAVSLCVALVLTTAMGLRWHRTGKIMPAGLVALLSGGMSVFYVWNMLNAEQLLQSAPKAHK